MEQGYYSVIATPREALYEAACAMDNQDVPHEADIWCCGASFDFPILKYAYHVIGMKEPWEFSNEMCLRTLKKLNKGARIERAGTHHNALDDAVHQAKLVQHILQLNPDMDS